MADDLQRLIVSLEARTKAFDNALAKANGVANQRARAIETRFSKMNRGISAQFTRTGGVLVGAFASGAALRGAQRLVDTATRIDNALKVAGLSGAELEGVYQRLLAVAQKHGAPLESLVTLYVRLSLVQNELGVSSADIVKFTDNVAAALKVAGTDANKASGALLQLAQALGSGTVRAEEFNSILEGATPIAQAVARGLKEAGGSVAKLRQLVIDGKVSSQAWFRAFEAGSGTLQKQAKKAETTIEQAYGKIETALIDAARKFDQATDTSGKTADLMERLAGAIDFIGEAFSRVAEGPLGKFVSLLGDADDKARSLFAFLKKFSLVDEIGVGIGGILAPETPSAPSLTGNDAIYAQIKTLMVVRDQKLAEGIKGAAHILDQKIAELEAELEFGGGPSTRGGRRKAAGAVSLADLENPADKLESILEKFVDNVIAAESGGDTNAKNPLSSATGLGQFIESTWLRLFRENFPDRAAGMADATILGLRTNAEVSKQMIEAYARENAGVLQKAGVSVDEAALQLAHFLGPNGAIKVLSAAPGTPIAGLLSAGAIKANPTILGNGATVDSVKAYAQERAFGGGAIGQDIELRREQVDLIRETMGALAEETAAITAETSMLGASNAERERERVIRETLNELQKQGIELTPQIIAGVEAEANARYGAVAASEAAIEANDRLIEKQRELQQMQADIGNAFQGALKGLISDLVSGKSATEALTNAVSRLADRLLDIALDALFANIFKSVLGGGFGFGFADGGPVKMASGGRVRGPGGPRSDKVPAMLSNGEYVVNAAATRKHAALLEAINSGSVRNLAAGGFAIPTRMHAPANDNGRQAAPIVNLRNINLFDPAQVVSQALGQPEGVKVVLNMVRHQPAAFRAAMGG